MVPFSAFASGYWTFGSPKLERYNGLPAVQILGQAAPGFSSGDAMATVERLAQQLPPGVGLEFTGLSYEERLAGSQSSFTLVLSLVVVFLCLAALYESWSIPRSEEHTSELQSLMRISYAVFCLKQKKLSAYRTNKT